MNGHIKLECLTLASVFSLVYCNKPKKKYAHLALFRNILRCLIKFENNQILPKEATLSKWQPRDTKDSNQLKAYLA